MLFFNNKYEIDLNKTLTILKSIKNIYKFLIYN